MATSTFKLPTLEARAGAVTVDTDLVPVFQGAAGASGKKAVKKGAKAEGGAYDDVIARIGEGDVFTGRHGSLQFVRFGGLNGAQNALFVGMGKIADLTEQKLRLAGGMAWGKLTAEKVRSVAIDLDSLTRGLKSDLPAKRAARVFAEGFLLGAYKFDKYKSKPKAEKAEYQGVERVVFVGKDRALARNLEKELEQVAGMVEAVNITRDWSNEPSNVGTPEYFAGEAQRLAREYGLKCTILTEKDAAKENMGLFLGVGQGSVREGRIVVLEYAPKSKAAKTLAYVGKGVTFDSGGISIKPSLRMEEMKHDMTGAATIMGAIVLAAKWKVKNRVVAILAFTENMPDGDAIQPGNIIISRAGKTVEIINTDAEGRLILADVLDYAHVFKPDAIVDVATLTGAVTVALGKHCCAVLGNNQALIDSLRRVGDENGERIWQLPIFDEYFDDLKSDYADMKNSANDGLGGTIRGAIFLKQFIHKGMKWAHLDIAATASGLGHVPYYPKKGASGTYVRTLAQLANDFR